MAGSLYNFLGSKSAMEPETIHERKRAVAFGDTSSFVSHFVPSSVEIIHTSPAQMGHAHINRDWAPLAGRAE